MTLLASSEIVLQITPPQPSSNALPMTFAFVPGGPEPMTKGLGSFRPLTTVSSVAIALPPDSLLDPSTLRCGGLPLSHHKHKVDREPERKGDEVRIGVEHVERPRLNHVSLVPHGVDEAG